MEIDLTELYNLQKGLDLDIANRHNVTYDSTFEKRLLSLLVELGEFANETRCFKYWSTKGPSPKDVILEEYVDGLHFILSLGVKLNPRKFIYKIEKFDNNLTDAILRTYKESVKLKDEYTLDQYEIAFSSFLGLILYLGFTSEEVKNAYLSKLKINYNRQENNY